MWKNQIMTWTGVKNQIETYIINICNILSIAIIELLIN